MLEIFHLLKFDISSIFRVNLALAGRKEKLGPADLRSVFCLFYIYPSSCFFISLLHSYSMLMCPNNSDEQVFHENKLGTLESL